MVSLVGRDDVLAKIDDWVARIGLDVGSLPLFCGPRGIGRSAVLEAVRAAARRKNLLVVDIRDASDLAEARFAPAALVIDDVDRRDAQFETALFARAAQVRGYPLLLAATRTADGDCDLTRYERAGFTVVQLGPLDDRAIGTIVRSAAHLARSNVNDAQCATIIAACAGYPRYAVEMATSPHDAVPATIRAEIDRFAGAHGPDALRIVGLLACAATGDGPPDLDLCRRLDSRVSGPTMSALYRAAKRAGLFDEAGRFRHPLVQLACETRLGEDRAALHRRCAALLAENTTSAADYTAIAQHYLAAGDVRKAHDYFTAAVNDDLINERLLRAVERLEHISAVDAFAGEPRARALYDLGRTYDRLGRPHDAFARFTAAMEIFEQIGAFDRHARAAVEAARVLTRGSDLIRTERFCLRVLATLRTRPFDFEQGMILLMLASNAFARQDEQKLTAILTELSEHESQWPAEMRSHAYCVRGLARAFDRGEARRADRATILGELDKAIAAAEAAGTLTAQAAAYDVLAYVHSLRSEVHHAAASAERSLELACTAADVVKIKRAQGAVMRVSSLSGRLTRVLSFADIIAEGGERGRFDDTEMTPLARAATLLRSEAHLAEEPYRKRYEAARNDGELLELQDVTTAYAIVLRYRDDRASAAAICGTTIAALKRFDPSLPDMAFIIAESGSDAAIAAAQRLIDDAVPIAHPRLADGVRRLFAAVLERRAGRRSGARRDATAAARDFEALGWQWFRAMALRVAGSLCDARAVEAQMGAIGEPAAAPSTLSLRETAIARYAANGRSNREIASALGIAEKTVHVHMLAVLRKLGIRSRHQIAERFSDGSY